MEEKKNLNRKNWCVLYEKEIIKTVIMTTLNGSIFLSVVILLALTQSGRSLEISDFYDFEREYRLENGANKNEFVKLDTQIHFYSDVYDHIYVSSQTLSKYLEIPLNIFEIT